MCECFFCRRRKKLIEKYSLVMLLIFLLLPSIMAVSGNSSFFGFNPDCQVNQSYVNNCSAVDIDFKCSFDNSHLINYATFGINSTTYLPSRISQDNFSQKLHFNEQHETISEIYNWSDVIIFDTAGTISVYYQNITFQKDCPDCFPDIVESNSSCGVDDLKNVTYTDNQACGFGLPSDWTAPCDYCIPDWQCKSYDSGCFSGVSIKQCLSVADNNLCYNQTGLASDSFILSLDDFKTPCTFDDFRTESSMLQNFYAEVGFNQYPYVEIGEPINIVVYTKINNTRILISSVQMQIADSTIPFDIDIGNVLYDKTITINEYGDFPFIITGNYNGQNVFSINGMLYAREFISLQVELFENRNLSKRYVNNLAEVVALKYNDAESGRDINSDLMGLVVPFEKTNLVTKQLVKLNRTTLYDYKEGVRGFHAPYDDGIGLLNLPKENNTVWEIHLFNSESSYDYIFDEYNYAFIQMSSPTNSNDVTLGTLKVLVDAEVKYYVSNFDIRFWNSMVKIIILVFLILLGILAMIYGVASTGDPSIAVKIGIALLGAIPVLFMVLSWIAGFFT